jgi:hypothetical protein
MGFARKFSRWCVAGIHQNHGPLGGSSFSSVPENQRVIRAMQMNRMYFRRVLAVYLPTRIDLHGKNRAPNRIGQ